MDLVRFEGSGNSVVVRVTGMYGDDVLECELSVGSRFVSGQLPLWLSAVELLAWRNALDLLDEGHDVTWLAGGRGPGFAVEHSEHSGRVDVTVSDPAGSSTRVRITVPVDDDWFDEAYERLDEVVRAKLPAALDG